MASTRLLLVATVTVALVSQGHGFAIPSTLTPQLRSRASFSRATNGFLSALSASQPAWASPEVCSIKEQSRTQPHRRDLLRILGGAALLGTLPERSSAAESKGTVLVVGTTGYMGVSVAKALISQGYQVRGLSRNADVKKNPPIDLEVDWRVGDLTRPESLKGLLVGVDKVVWCIGSG
eukprot:CAMPEP_0114131032 /NCGR_PEP_ID=MMETSP0043_2-20121206/12333_1 /TAXON_ID=464988 /ORGANISM="Hemiselmis andersenii, Strain CCMP644" /LENGTH=177 /DNA_ID=CAMNT_0001224429 /DNA_START=44 /DNA_END=573 /DNA_ORIENTATION=+